MPVREPELDPSSSQSSPSAVATRARTSTSDQSRPYAPAFMRTPPPGGSRDRARELETAEPGVARAVEAHRVRRAAAGAEDVARRSRPPRARPRAGARARRRRRRSEQVRAETDREDGEALVAREAKRLDELGERARSREARAPARRRRSSSAARAGTPCSIRDHSARPSTTARAIRHGSPTPSVTTTSPGRAHASASADGVVEGRRPAAPRRRRHVVEHELPGDARKRVRRDRRSRRSRSPRPRCPSAAPSSWWSCRVRS